MMLITKFVVRDARAAIEAEIEMPSYLPGIGQGRVATP
jgi:hypothetical protein